MPEVTKVAYGLTIGDLKYGNSRPGVVEASLRPGETLEDALDELDERLNAWHRKRYPHLYENKEPWIPGTELPDHMKTEITFEKPSPMPIIDRKWEQFEIDVENSQTMEELQAVINRNNPFPGKFLSLINAKRQSLKTTS